MSMVLTSVIANPTIVNDELRDCQIHGNGGIQHYGLYEQGRPCIIFINCKKMIEQDQIKSE